MYFYPHSPCGERRGQGASNQTALQISIHTLLAESDIILIALLMQPIRFLSTLSLRRATVAQSAIAGNKVNFYPHSPCGERHILTITTCIALRFLSTLSLRRATSGNNFRSRIRQRFLSTLSLRRATAKVHKTVEHFCAYETNFMGIASSC